MFFITAIKKFIRKIKLDIDGLFITEKSYKIGGEMAGLFGWAIFEKITLKKWTTYFISDKEIREVKDELSRYGITDVWYGIFSHYLFVKLYRSDLLMGAGRFTTEDIAIFIKNNPIKYKERPVKFNGIVIMPIFLPLLWDTFSVKHVSYTSDYKCEFIDGGK
jgi:hypothetical protein